MSKCINCGASDADYQHTDKGYVCANCIGDYFTCPDCGTLYDNNDFKNGDQGNGFCKNCAANH